MNIFVFDTQPHKAALWLDDVRQNKMILETCQLLSTAIHQNGNPNNLTVYKPTHKHHPCTVWVGKSRGNFKWALDYLKALGTIRNPRHKSLQLLSSFNEYAKDGEFEQEEQTPFANCARNLDQGLDFTDEPNITKAYQAYISERWKRDTIKLSWEFGDQPQWRTK